MCLEHTVDQSYLIIDQRIDVRRVTGTFDVARSICAVVVPCFSEMRYYINW